MTAHEQLAEYLADLAENHGNMARGIGLYDPIARNLVSRAASLRYAARMLEAVNAGDDVLAAACRVMTTPATHCIHCDRALEAGACPEHPNPRRLDGAA